MKHIKKSIAKTKKQNYTKKLQVKKKWHTLTKRQLLNDMQP